jgi:hypothetical protein
MNEYKVSCITKSPPNSMDHQHITHIGGFATSGWRLTKNAAIRRIESKKEAYYTVDVASAKKAYIAVVREVGSAPYLRTYADGNWNNNLLSQPACPDSYTVIE